MNLSYPVHQQETLFDPKAFHGDIPEVRNAMELAPLAPETILRQTSMYRLLRDEGETFHRRLFEDPQTIEAWKVQKLQSIVDWAFTTTSFYQSLYKGIGYDVGGIRSLEDFRRLPTITKEDVIKNFPVGMPSRDVDLKQCRWMSSSGSSGQMTQIVLPQGRADLDTLFKYRMFEFMGDFRLDPRRWLYNIHFCLWWHTSILGQLPAFSLKQTCPPEKVYEHLRLLRPQVLSSIGSYLGELASLHKSLRELGIQVVSTNSETTSLQERERWSDIFQVPVLDEYSSEELDILAMECRYRHYHVVEDDCHVEVVHSDDAEMGEIVGTDLWNTAMPIIRYRQGDLAEMDDSQEPCSCGSHFRRIKNFHGRADQAFTNLTGRRIPPGSLLNVLEDVLCRDDSNIANFRLIQETHEQIQVLLTRNLSSEAIPSWVAQSLRARLVVLFQHPLTVTFKVVEALPQEKNCKRRSLISRVKEC